jgi:beta-glucosidase
VNRRQFLASSLATAGAALVGSHTCIAAADQVAGSVSPSSIQRARFPDGFLWGTATAAYQV